ncbi:hypothetical protein FB451DRAFT_1170352 [Mycena latifolia]|nr:hypothetical protein FB451DRAFT_1170352 [Mycena latifolia]
MMLRTRTTSKFARPKHNDVPSRAISRDQPAPPIEDSPERQSCHPTFPPEWERETKFAGLSVNLRVCGTMRGSCSAPESRFLPAVVDYAVWVMLLPRKLGVGSMGNSEDLEERSVQDSDAIFKGGSDVGRAGKRGRCGVGERAPWAVRGPEVGSTRSGAGRDAGSGLCGRGSNGQRARHIVATRRQAGNEPTSRRATTQSQSQVRVAARDVAWERGAVSIRAADPARRSTDRQRVGVVKGEGLSLHRVGTVAGWVEREPRVSQLGVPRSPELVSEHRAGHKLMAPRSIWSGANGGWATGGGKN